MVKHQLQELLRFWQRLLRGATGKDRQEIFKLKEQLLKVQVGYDHLQQKYDHQHQERDRLEKRWTLLQGRYQQIQKDYAALQHSGEQAQQTNIALEADRNEQKDLFELANQENIELREEKTALLEDMALLQLLLRQSEDEKEEIAGHRGRLMGQVAYLQSQLSRRQYQSDGRASGNHLEAEKLFASDPEEMTVAGPEAAWGLTPRPDLTGLLVALVGGHETAFKEIQEELGKQGLKRCVHVPPHSRESNSRHQIEGKIGNCDLVVVVTSYLDHTVSRSVKQLDKLGRLSGPVIWVGCHGKSGLLREIFNHFNESVSPQ